MFVSHHYANATTIIFYITFDDDSVTIYHRIMVRKKNPKGGVLGPQCSR